VPNTPNSRKLLQRASSLTSRVHQRIWFKLSKFHLTLLKKLNTLQLMDQLLSIFLSESHSDPSLLSERSALILLTILKPSSNGQLSLLPTELSSLKMVCHSTRQQSSNFHYLAIHHPSQMRPRSRTLKAVHAAILEDIVTPTGILGRTTKITKDSGRKERVFLDPLDKE